MERRAKYYTKARRKDWRAELVRQIAERKLPAPRLEYMFHPVRKWRADLAYPVIRVLFEVEGGLYHKGGHNTVVGYTNNCEKYNEAELLGYHVIRFTPAMVENGIALKYVLAALEIYGKDQLWTPTKPTIQS